MHGKQYNNTYISSDNKSIIDKLITKLPSSFYHLSSECSLKHEYRICFL